MANSKSIGPDVWVHARESLIRYFATRHGRGDAEDLAQEVLCRLLDRDDFEFDPADFLRVCKGFARHVAQEQFRFKSRFTDFEEDPAVPAHVQGGKREIESRILLEQIFRQGKQGLKSTEWDAILNAANRELQESPKTAATSGERVFLHRVRAKLRAVLIKKRTSIRND
jgi:DNA-directed RNA polymerase specialized sigma24 family protein